MLRYCCYNLRRCCCQNQVALQYKQGFVAIRTLACLGRFRTIGRAESLDVHAPPGPPLSTTRRRALRGHWLTRDENSAASQASTRSYQLFLPSEAKYELQSLSQAPVNIAASASHNIKRSSTPAFSFSSKLQLTDYLFIFNSFHCQGDVDNSEFTLTLIFFEKIHSFKNRDSKFSALFTNSKWPEYRS